MRMEYFNKIQCYRPSIEIVDAPVSIDEMQILLERYAYSEISGTFILI